MALPKKSRGKYNGGYRKFEEEKVFESGIYSIWVSAEYSELSGKMIDGSKIYMICDDEDAVGNCHKTLSAAKKELKEFL